MSANAIEYSAEGEESGRDNEIRKEGEEVEKQEGREDASGENRLGPAAEPPPEGDMGRNIGGAIDRPGNSEGAAIVRLQSAVRRFLAVRRVRQLAREVYEKAFDDNNACFFYYNRLTGESRWTLPTILGSTDLLPTPRSAARAARVGVLDEETATAAGAAGSVDPTHDGLSTVRRRFRRKFRLKRFLHEHRLDRYFAALEEEGFDDPEALVKMDDTDMATLGVRRGERHVLHTALDALRDRMERAGWPAEAVQPDQPPVPLDGPRPQRRLSITTRQDEDVQIEEVRAGGWASRGGMTAAAAGEGVGDEDDADVEVAVAQQVGRARRDVEQEDPWGDSYGRPGALARGWRHRRKSAAAEFRKAQLERAMVSGMGQSRRPPSEESQLGKEPASRQSSQRPPSGHSAWPPMTPWMERVGGSRGQSRELPSRGGWSQLGDVTQEADREIVVDVLFEGCAQWEANAFPQEGNIVRVHYEGFLEDGIKFESSRDRGRAFQFRLGAGHVIQGAQATSSPMGGDRFELCAIQEIRAFVGVRASGWELAIPRISRGTRARFLVPPAMAYGSTGRLPKIPPDAALEFEVQLIDFFDPEGALRPQSANSTHVLHALSSFQVVVRDAGPRSGVDTAGGA